MSVRPSSSCAMRACWPLRLTVASRSITSGSISSTERWRLSISSTTFNALRASWSGLASIAWAPLDLAGGREQADAPDLLEVHADRVVERDRIHHLDVEQHLVVDLLDVFDVL